MTIGERIKELRTSFGFSQVDFADKIDVSKQTLYKYENNIITTYESLSEVTVKKGDVVSQGQTIGKSGTNKIEKDLGNHLYFQVTKDDKVLNPENCYNKDIKDL